MSKKNKRINILNKCLEKATTKGISVNDIKFAEYMVELMNKSLKSKVGKSSDIVDVDLNDKCSDPGNLSLPKNYFRGFYPDYKKGKNRILEIILVRMATGFSKKYLVIWLKI